jgi:hypothetical protein
MECELFLNRINLPVRSGGKSSEARTGRFLQLERRSTNNQELDIPLSMSAEMPIFGHGLDYWTGALAAGSHLLYSVLFAHYAT